MKKHQNATLGRREVLRTLATGATVMAAPASLLGEARAATKNDENYQDKRKARYHPNSPEVQNFYRVNRYPAK
jgi:hypothetical protein